MKKWIKLWQKWLHWLHPPWDASCRTQLRLKLPDNSSLSATHTRSKAQIMPSTTNRLSRSMLTETWKLVMRRQWPSRTSANSLIGTNHTAGTTMVRVISPCSSAAWCYSATHTWTISKSRRAVAADAFLSANCRDLHKNRAIASKQGRGSRPATPSSKSSFIQRKEQPCITTDRKRLISFFLSYLTPRCF